MVDFDFDVMEVLMAQGESRSEAEEEVLGLRFAEFESDFGDDFFDDSSEVEYGRRFG